MIRVHHVLDSALQGSQAGCSLSLKVLLNRNVGVSESLDQERYLMGDHHVMIDQTSKESFPTALDECFWAWLPAFQFPRRQLRHKLGDCPSTGLGFFVDCPESPVPAE